MSTPIGRIKPISRTYAQYLDYLSCINPRIADELRYGASPEQIFKKMCEQRGINPDEFIEKIKKGLNG